MESIITAIITGVLALVGVIISNYNSNKKVETSLDKQQAITETKIDELTREVRLHNNFAQRVPVIEEQVKVISHRLADLENLEKIK